MRLTAEQDAWLASQTRQFRQKSDVVRDLIDSARLDLTGGSKLPAYCVGAGTHQHLHTQSNTMQSLPAKQAQHRSLPTEAVSAVEALPQKKAKKFEPVTMRGLEKFEEDIKAFWKAKKGAKNERAWSILLTELSKILTKYGEAAMLEQLRLGTQAGTWSSISCSRYEQFSKPRSGPASQPEVRHPASRVFTAAKGFDDGPTTNPILKDMF